MTSVSRAQMRALEVIRDGRIYKVGDFIRAMWPDKVKPREPISGGYVLSAMALLKRLERAGLVSGLDLTTEGRNLLWQEQDRLLAKAEAIND